MVWVVGVGGGKEEENPPTSLEDSLVVVEGRWHTNESFKTRSCGSCGGGDRRGGGRWVVCRVSCGGGGGRARG